MQELELSWSDYGTCRLIRPGRPGLCAHVNNIDNRRALTGHGADAIVFDADQGLQKMRYFAFLTGTNQLAQAAGDY